MKIHFISFIYSARIEFLIWRSFFASRGDFEGEESFELFMGLTRGSCDVNKSTPDYPSWCFNSPNWQTSLFLDIQKRKYLTSYQSSAFNFEQLTWHVWVARNWNSFLKLTWISSLSWFGNWNADGWAWCHLVVFHLLVAFRSPMIAIFQNAIYINDVTARLKRLGTLEDGLLF